MPQKKSLSLPDPDRFDLTSFADILPRRDPVVGEDPGSYPVFHAGMTQSLDPATPYECVIAESLISIEWEYLQHRRMRDACLREAISEQICEAFVIAQDTIYHHLLEQDLEDHLEDGGTEQDWQHPGDFDEDAAQEAGQDLAARASSHDPKVQAAAYEEIEALGITPLNLMRMTYDRTHYDQKNHDARMRDLERRRHDVMRDFDKLQASRRIASDVMEAEVVEALNSKEAMALTKTKASKATKT